MKSAAWLRVVVISVAVAVIIYGLLWGITAGWGTRGLRAHYESLPRGYIPPQGTSMRLIVVERFDAEKFKHPGKDQALLYFGRFRSPAPFLVTSEVAEATETGGHFSRLMWQWWMGDYRLVHQETLWSFGDPFEPDF